LNEATNSVLPDYDDEEQTDIMDGDKGGWAANAHSSVKAFVDYYHRLENVKKNCGHAGGTLYTRAFHADRQITLDGIKDEMSDIRNMDAYMATYADDEQYPVCRLELGLRKFGSCVEAINSANKPARKVDMAHWLETMANIIVKRANSRKQEADNWPSPYPPRIQKLMLEQQALGALIPALNCIGSDTKTVCRVTDEVGHHQVTVALLKESNPGVACSSKCGVPAGVPCRHCWAAMKALSLRMVDYLASHNTTAGWRKQYAEVKSAPEVLPSTADYERFKHLVDQSLALPPMSKRPQGRPRKGVRFPSFAEQAKTSNGKPPKKRRKAPTCRICYTVGCAANRCKNLDAIIAGTWIPPAAEDLPMDPVVDMRNLTRKRRGRKFRARSQ